MSDFWVFGYGSLMWNPGFETLEQCPATLYGLHRALCIHSWVHRGTQEHPGLVLGLDKGGSCRGMAFKTSGKNREKTIDYLRKRELVTNVYLECWRMIKLENGERVSALVYRVDQQHPQYAAGLSAEQQYETVKTAVGSSGNNPDYVRKTLQFMNEVNISDATLEYICKKLG